MSSLLQDLSSLLGADAVMDGAGAEREFGHCTTGARRSLAAAVLPKDLDQVVAVVRLANERRFPVYPVSTGRNWGYGQYPVTDGCVLLNLSRLNRIVEPLDPVSGLVTLEPGVTQGDLAAYLERERLPFLVPTSGAGPAASVVGNALERGHGITPFVDHFAAVVNLEAVLPDGSIYRSPHLAMKATAGGLAEKWGIGPYVDGLFAQGNLGVVTKMTLALARRPERIRAFVCGLRSDADLEAGVTAIQSVVEALPGLVGAVNLMNSLRVLSMSAPYPRDRLGPGGVMPAAVLAELTSRHRVAPWTIFGTLYGTCRTVAAAEREIRARLSSLAPRLSTARLTFIGPESAQWLNRAVQSVPLLRSRLGRVTATLDASMAIVAGRPNQMAMPLAYWKSGRQPDLSIALDPARDGCGLIWYAPLVEIKPAVVRRFSDMIAAILPAHGFEPLNTLITISPRCFVATVPLLFDRASAEATAAAQKCLEVLLETGARHGFFPYRVGAQSMEWLMGQAPDYWRFISRLKSAADPAGIISPGRYAPRH